MTPQRLKQPIPMVKSLIFQMRCLNSLKEKFVGLSGAASPPESGNITSKASSADSASSHEGVFDPMVVIKTEQTSAPTSVAEGEDKLDSSEFVPSIF